MSEILTLKPKDIIVNQDRRGRHFAPSKADIKRIGESMKEYGQLEPVMVREATDGKYELVFGYTRHAAAVEFGLPLKAELINCDDQTAILMNIKENTDRNATSVVDDAHNQQRLREMTDPATGQKLYTNAMIAKIYKCTPAWVGQISKLLQLSERTQKLVHEGKLGVTVATAMLDSEDDAKTIEAEAVKMVEETEAAAAAGTPHAKKKAKATRTKVKAKAKAKKAEKKGEPATVTPRTNREIFDFFQSLTGPAESPELREFGKKLCGFVKNKVSEKVTEKYLRELIGCPVNA